MVTAGRLVREAGFDQRRSPLWRHMRDHYAEICGWLANGATWPVIIKALIETRGEAIYTARVVRKGKVEEGHPPSAEAARQTFVKVREHMERQKRKERAPRRAVPAAPAPVIPVEADEPTFQMVGTRKGVQP